MIVKPYPKDDEPRTLGMRRSLLDELAARIAALGLDRGDLLFASTETAGGKPPSRNTFVTRVWLPAVKKAQIAILVYATLRSPPRFFPRYGPGSSSRRQDRGVNNVLSQRSMDIFHVDSDVLIASRCSGSQSWCSVSGRSSAGEVIRLV